MTMNIMQGKIKRKLINKPPTGESGLVKPLPLPDPGAVNSDPVGADIKNIKKYTNGAS